MDHCRNNLRKARRSIKRRLRQLQRNWWQQFIDEYTLAAERGDMGNVYKTLRNLGTRDSKPKPITADELRTHFMKVPQDRYENDPGELGASVRKMDNYRHLREVPAF